MKKKKLSPVIPVLGENSISMQVRGVGDQRGDVHLLNFPRDYSPSTHRAGALKRLSSTQKWRACHKWENVT